MDKPKVGRPALPKEQLKIRESVYLLPDVHKWLTDKASKRDASLSSLLNVILTDRMNKEKANS